MIYSEPPKNWKELQNNVCDILNECGYLAESPKKIPTARTEVLEVDVYAEDNSIPKQIIVCECKHWNKKLPQSVVHTFRAQINDIGADQGLLISQKGFQAGAISAAKYSNCTLLTWNEFEVMYESIWYKNYFLRQVDQICDEFIEYFEPCNSRVSNELSILSEEKKEKFADLRERHFNMFVLCSHLSAMYYTSGIASLGKNSTFSGSTPLQLPISNNKTSNFNEFPNEVMDAISYKQLLVVINDYVSMVMSEVRDIIGNK